MPPENDYEKVVDRMLEDFLIKVSFNSQIIDFSCQRNESFLRSVNPRPTPKIRPSSYYYTRSLDSRHRTKMRTIVLTGVVCMVSLIHPNLSQILRKTFSHSTLTTKNT